MMRLRTRGRLPLRKAIETDCREQPIERARSLVVMFNWSRRILSSR